MVRAEAISIVRELHKPIARQLPRSVRHECHGCDPGSRFEDYADWPCSTAEVVYTAEEIDSLRRNG